MGTFVRVSSPKEFTSPSKLIESPSCYELRKVNPSPVTNSERLSSPQKEIDMRTLALTQTSCVDAAAAWLESRTPYISTRTFHDYQAYIKILTSYFGEMELTEMAEMKSEPINE